MDGKALRVGRGFAAFEFLRGFWSLFAGCLTLFNRPEYAGKLRAPFLANFVVLSAVFFGLFFGVWELFDAVLEGDWGWFEFLHPVGSWATGVLAMLLAAVTLWFVSPVLIETVIGPFLEPIAETTERLHGGPAMKPDATGAWKGMIAGLRNSAQILAIQLMVLPLALLLSLTAVGVVPVLLLAAYLNAIVWFDIPMARRGYGLRQRIRIVRVNWAHALGFGLAFQIGLLIPLFNIVLLTPGAAVAVSSLYFRFEKGPGRGQGASGPPPAPAA